MTPGDLLAAGLTRGALAKRVQRGALFRRSHGVYSLSPGELSREGEWTAALLAIGVGAVLSRLSAATLWRAWRYAETAIDVLCPRRHRPVDGTRLRECRALHPLDVYVFHGIRVTTVARTCVDLTDVLIAEELTNVIKEAAFHKRFSVEATRAAMARANGRHNLHVLEQALEDYLAGSAGLKSRKERTFLALLRSAGLPKPRVNVHVEGIEVDFHWPRQRLVVEIDGHHHARPPCSATTRGATRSCGARAGRCCASAPTRSNGTRNGSSRPSDGPRPDRLRAALATFPGSSRSERRGAARHSGDREQRASKGERWVGVARFSRRWVVGWLLLAPGAD